MPHCQKCDSFINTASTASSLCELCEHAHKLTYAKRMVARCINAARKANHAAIREANPDDRAMLRELARINMRAAKQSKCKAREQGEWA